MEQPSVEKVKGFFRGQRTLAIMPTLRCVANCESCGTLSSPFDKTELTLEEISECIDEAKRLGFANIVFTGGEATLCWDNLLAAIKKTKDYGLPSRIVTNAHWSKSLTIAKKMVNELKAAGLSEINFSTGDEHTKFIPISNVINAILASVSCGFRPAVMIEDKFGNAMTKRKFVRNHKIRTLLKNKCLYVSEGPWMPLNPNEVRQYKACCVANSENLDAYLGCDTILQSLTVMSDRNVAACCGFGARFTPELIVSNIREPNFLERAINNVENDFLKVWLHYEGPIKILHWAAKKNPAINWENMYAHCCQACLRIYKDPLVQRTIKANYLEKMGPILGSAWLEEVFIPKRFKIQ